MTCPIFLLLFRWLRGRRTTTAAARRIHGRRSLHRACRKEALKECGVRGAGGWKIYKMYIWGAGGPPRRPPERVQAGGFARESGEGALEAPGARELYKYDLLVRSSGRRTWVHPAGEAVKGRPILRKTQLRDLKCVSVVNRGRLRRPKRGGGRSRRRFRSREWLELRSGSRLRSRKWPGEESGSRLRDLKWSGDRSEVGSRGRQRGGERSESRLRCLNRRANRSPEHLGDLKWAGDRSERRLRDLKCSAVGLIWYLRSVWRRWCCRRPRLGGGRDGQSNRFNGPAAGVCHIQVNGAVAVLVDRPEVHSSQSDSTVGGSC
jgi:hypothetical protein